MITLIYIFFLLQDIPAPAPAVDSAMVAAAAMVVVMVVLSPSPQSHKVLPGDTFKKESRPSSPSETLEFDLNLYPFMVLCNTGKDVQQES